MWKWIAYGAAAVFGAFIVKKTIDAYQEKPYDEGYRHGREGTKAKYACPPTDLTNKMLQDYCTGFVQGAAARKAAGA